jgi:hypothetical protein
MTSEEREGLRRIRGFHLWLWFFLLSAVPVTLIVILGTHSLLLVAIFASLWIAEIARCIVRTSFSHCPRCGGYFHSTNGSPRALHKLLARNCIHCGLPLRVERVIYPSME